MTEMYALVLKTKLSGETLERLLASVCQRPYTMVFDGTEVTPKGEKKIMRIAFDHADDRIRFRQGLRRLANAAPAVAARPDKPRTRISTQF